MLVGWANENDVSSHEIDGGAVDVMAGAALEDPEDFGEAVGVIRHAPLARPHVVLEMEDIIRGHKLAEV